MADLEQTGLEFITEGVDAFEDAIDGASKSVEQFEDTGSSAESSFNGFQEIVTGALRAVGEAALDLAINAGKAVTDFVSDSFQGALDAEKGLTRLEGAITRAGDAAPVTQKQALDLSQSLKGLAGGSDDAVIAAESVLLKFQSIGKDVFPQALQTTLDLAAVLGTDAAGAAEQLGRALGNPEAASRLLKQAGVFLTDQEKDQIKTFIDAGDTASAQQFILEKLAGATQGAAEQMAGSVGGQMAIFKETIADAGEGIATAFLPILKTLMDEYLKPLLPIITDIANAIANDISGAFGGFSGNLSGIQEQLQPITSALQELFNTFMQSAPEMQALGKDLFSFLNDELGVSLPTVLNNVIDIIHTLTDIWRDHGTQIMTVIEVAFKFIFATISGTVTLISGIVSVALELISGAFDFWTAVFSGNWAKAWDIVLNTVQKIGDTIISTVTSFVNQATSIVTIGMQDAVNDFVMNLTGGIQGGIINAINALREQWGGFNEAGVSLMDGLRQGIWRGLGWIIDAAVGVAQAAVNAFRDIWNSHSPSRVGIDLGYSLPQGMAIGLDKGSALIDNAMNQSIMPAMMPMQMLGGMSSNSSLTNNYNLNMNGNSDSQGVIADFGIMRSLAGG